MCRCGKGNLVVVEQHRNNLQAVVKEVHVLKLKVKETMFEKVLKMSKNGVVLLRIPLLKWTITFLDWTNG